MATSGSKEARQLEQVRYNLEKGLAKINENKVADTNVGESGKDINVVTKENVEKSDKIKYNKTTETERARIKKAIQKDSRKKSFEKYNTSADFFELDYSDMKKIIAQGSNEALKTERKGQDNGVFIAEIGEDNNILVYAYFDLLNKSNNNNEFGVTEIRYASKEMEEKYENRSSNATNRFLETSTRGKQDSNIRDNESTRDGRETGKNDELLEGKLSKQGIDERRQSAKERRME